eukprot:s706_g12.t1
MSVAPNMDHLDTVKGTGGTGIRSRDPQVIGASERGNAYDVTGSPSPAKDHHPRGALHRKLLERKVTWILATTLTVLLCIGIAQPAPCHHVGRCMQEHARIQDLRNYSSYIAAALASVMLHELASVILTHRTARKAIHLIPNIRESLLPSVLLCITFLVLIIENLVFVIGETPWFAHAANLGHPELDGQPVYTVFYAEWLINVPILLILAGSIALQRPTSEVAEPLVVTNVYIVVLERTDPVPAATIAQRLESLGGVRIMSDVEHQNRQQADVLLRQAKESQKGSAATGANTISFLQSLAAIRGDGGSARKRGLVLQELSSYVWKLCRGCSWVGAISVSSFAGHMKLPRLLLQPNLLMI